MVLPLLESLESRRLLSSVGWPSAPFSNASTRATIYVNQFGKAVLNRPASAGAFDGYNLYYDDSGLLSIHTTGAATDLAFYYTSGRPTSVAVGGGTAQITNVVVPPDKRMQYIGIVPRASGSYQLQVDGPPENFIETIPVSKVLNAGSGGSDISGVGDFDIYRFTLPRSGNWMFRVIPDRKHAEPTLSSPPLDATMNIFDVRGNPVGGSFTQTIDRGGPGVAEYWLGIGLSAGATYLMRVDGAGSSVGGYGVSASLALGPDVGITAVVPKAGQPKGSGRFTVVRTDNSSKPLTVRYTISGTARPGVDYKMLSGSVTIPGNQLWASVDVSRLLGAVAGKTVVLTLLPAWGFNLYPRSKATVTIR
ncbi:MAG: hypothetical protein ABSH20_23465 [Tepidisphaeraceae bacterium]|jgi:hypothetical protein